MTEVIVSVVIPVFNRENSIIESIDSVLNQTYEKFEIIVIDDASRDNTFKNIKNYKEQKVIPIRHNENRGGGAARNTGIRMSRGRYIAFLDSDDVWLPEKLDEQIKSIERLGQEWGGVYTGRIDILDGYQRTVVPDSEGQLSIPILTGKTSLASGSTLMIRKECFDNIGMFNENITRFQDLEFMLRFFSKYRIAVVKKPLAKINRYYKTQFTNIEKDTLFLISQVEYYLKEINKKEMNSILSYRYLQLAKNLMQGCGSFFDAIKYFIKAVILCPNTPIREYVSFAAIIGFRMTGLDIRKVRN